MDLIFLGIIAWSFFIGNKFVYRNKYLAILTGYVFINFFIYFVIPFHLEFKNTGRMVNIACLEPMVHIILGLWATQVILSNIEKDDFVRIAKAIAISGSLVAVFAIMQYFGFDPLYSIAKYNCGNRVSACLDNPNLVGNYLVLCLPLLFMFKNVRYALCIPLIMTGIFVTNCHFAQVMAVIVCWLYFFFKYRKNVVVVSALLLIVVLTGVALMHFDFAKIQTNEMSGRLKIWQFGVERFKANPLFGQGIGIWKTWQVRQTNDVGSTIWYYAHNDWLERAVEFGLVGIFFLVLVIVNSLRNFTYEGEVNISYLIMFIIFLVMMVGSFPFEVPTIALLGLVSFWSIEKL